MSQHDYAIDNNTGRNVRLDLNDVFSAIVSNNSGDTEPTVTFPFMWWLDTSTANAVMKQRNEADNAWVTVFTITPAGVINFGGGAGVAQYTGYSAIVGSAPYCTHADLAAALADAAVTAGSKILVVSNQTINTSAISIAKANLQIEFMPGVTFTNGSAGTGLAIAAGGVRIKGGRFSGFTIAISIGATFQFNFITECRFVSCASEVVEVDSAPVNVVANNITE